MTELTQDGITAAPEAVDMDSAALSRLRASIQADVDRELHHGAVALVARNGEICFHEAIGKSDLAADRDAQLSDRFWLASVTKSITAAAALKLIDEGRLNFSTRVGDVIPEFAVRGKSRVTIYHLLTHTAGTWAGFPPPPPLQWGPVLGQLSDYVAAVAAQPVTGRPGEHVVYNPFADFAVLGEVIHRVDGRPFNEIIRSEVLDPIGMSETTAGGSPDDSRRVPIRMAEETPGAAEVAVMNSLNDVIDDKSEIPGGGLFATVEDVFKFAEMLRVGGVAAGGRVLSPAMVEYSVQNHTGDKINQFWDFSKEDRGIDEFPANFMLCGGYARGEGKYHLSPLGYTASPSAFGAVGSGSTLWMVDPSRDLTFVFLSAGLMEGLGHFERLQRLSDLALAAVGS